MDVRLLKSCRREQKNNLKESDMRKVLFPLFFIFIYLNCFSASACECQCDGNYLLVD